jgi:hypothetical protein
MLSSEFDDVERFCLFVGHGRSGHSLIGALLDAHPNINIAHERDALDLIKQGRISRDSLFMLLYGQSRRFKLQEAKWTGYKYAVPQQHKGEFTSLRVIGDKDGVRTTSHLRRNPALLKEIHEITKVPVCVIHVKRHPLDNISTMARKGFGGDVDAAIQMYFKQCKTVSNIRKKFSHKKWVKWIDVYHEEFVIDTECKLKNICKNLNIGASQKYLKDCSKKVFKKPNKSRKKVNYKKGQIERVKRRLKNYHTLREYSIEDKRESG